MNAHAAEDGLPEEASARNLRLRVAAGGAAVLGGQVASRVLGLAGTLVIARYLSPKDFGIAAIAMVALTASDTFTSLGLGSAIQAMSPDEERDRTALGLSVATGAVIAIALLIGASPVAAMLGDSNAAPLLRFMAFALLLGRWTEVRRAILDRGLKFSITARIDFVSAAMGTATAVTAALLGAGAWALALQFVAAELVATLLLLRIRSGPRRPSLNRTHVRTLISFGGHLLANQLVVFSFNNVDDVVIGRRGGAAPLGLYAFAYRISNLPTYVITRSLNRVLIPAYASIRMEGRPLGPAYAAATRLVAFGAACAIGAIAALGPSALTELYGTRWDDSYTTLRILCIYGLLRSVGATSGALFLSMGRPQMIRRIAQWQLLLLVAIVLPAYEIYAIEGVAAAATLSLAGGTAVALFIAGRESQAGSWLILSGVLRSWTFAGGATLAGVAVIEVNEGPAGIALGGAVTLLMSLVLGRYAVGDELDSIRRVARDRSRPSKPS